MAVSSPNAEGSIRRVVSVAPREAWRTVVAVRMDRLTSGYQRADVLFRASSGDECRVPVWVHVSAPVQLVPDRLVLGPARPGKRTSKDCRLVFGAGIRVPSPNEVRITSRLGGLEFKLSKTSERIWNLRVTAPHPKDCEMLEGKITLSVPGGDLNDQELPFVVYTAQEAR